MAAPQPRPFQALVALAQIFTLLGALCIGGGVVYLVVSYDGIRQTYLMMDAFPFSGTANMKTTGVASAIWDALSPLLVGFCLLAMASLLRVAREVGVFYQRANAGL